MSLKFCFIFFIFFLFLIWWILRQVLCFACGWSFISHDIDMTKGHFTHETESPWPEYFEHSHYWEWRSQSKFASHYAWRTTWVCKCKMDGCRVYMNSYTASNGSSFMVAWTMFRNHLLEVGLTQNHETMAIWPLITVGLFYLIMCEDPHQWKSIKIAFVWQPGHIWLHTTL